MSGGSGSSGAGDEGAGAEAGPTVPVARSVVPPHALFFDPALMDFPLDEAGLYQSVHPDHHAVLLALGLSAGTVSSSPLLGSTLRDIQIGSRAAMTADATERVRAALRALLDAGRAQLVSVVAYAKSASRAHVDVVFRLPRAPDPTLNRSVTLS
jgi:hypothetical protein